MNNQPCIYCGKNQFSHYWTFHELTLIQCRDCLVIQLYPLPQNDELEKLYREEYSETAILSGKELSPERENELAFIAKQRSVRIQKLIPKGSFLEIGSSYGQLLLQMKTDGFQISGIELGRQAIKFSRLKYGIEVSDQFLNQNTYPEHSFDIICMMHVFEHLSKPSEMLDLCYKFIKPGGYLIMEIPNIEFRKYFASDARKKDLVHYPYHLGFYTRKTMENILRDKKFITIKTSLINDQKYHLHPSFIKGFMGNTLRLMGHAGIIWVTAQKPLSH